MAVNTDLRLAREKKLHTPMKELTRHDKHRHCSNPNDQYIFSFTIFE